MGCPSASTNEPWYAICASAVVAGLSYWIQATPVLPAPFLTLTFFSPGVCANRARMADSGAMPMPPTKSVHPPGPAAARLGVAEYVGGIVCGGGAYGLYAHASGGYPACM
eukprot:CAMPEP_0119309968 /NCGR_PEP_ID=MMETSP1333-20130426/17623_1 /TAXON_ID=418940 /ORGANISM="Scyphosphaera apsteinii, Strain RCC1455" /LENGTH=109 /DNA_ID=CAMNT_0007314067 /DNA_START=169 /DNA_END=498 /DNA_ORIENTATION=+